MKTALAKGAYNAEKPLQMEPLAEKKVLPLLKVFRPLLSFTDINLREE